MKIVKNCGIRMKICGTITISFFLFPFFLLTSCCTTKVDEINKNIVPNDMVHLSPGSAKILGNIVEIIEDGSNYSFKLKIIEVVGYGSATTPVSVGSNIIVNIDKNLISNSTQKEKYHEYNSSFKKLGFILKQQTNKRLGSNSAISWLVVSINEK